jgi:hypothetical protein
MSTYMSTNCEVVGWLLVDETARVLVRQENGRIFSQTTDVEGTFARQAIQTGAFRRGNPIVDPVTRETLGYELERLSNPLDALA